jgi:hypothetical protein
MIRNVVGSRGDSYCTGNCQCELCATDRTEACGRFVFNPATGALEIARAYRDKAAEAVMRDLRRTKLRVYFVFARLNRL